MLAPDTGHRYVDAAYSRHAQAPSPEELRPRQISTLADMDLPCSRMHWNRAEAPPNAAVSPAIPVAS